MSRIFCIAFLIAPSLAGACPDFYGQWKSSKDMTMAFTRKWANIEEKSKSFLEQVTGTEVISYSANEMAISDIPSRKIVIDGKEFEWAGTNQTVKYELLGCTENTVAIKYKLFGKGFISVLNFQSDDTYWEYMGSPDMAENAHTREYFVRVAKTKH